MTVYVAFFNTGNTTTRLSVKFADVHIAGTATCAVKDVWTQEMETTGERYPRQ
jgi:hypothetical protein